MMDFKHEDRCFYNMNFYEDLNLHNSTTEEDYLKYFLELTRDYGLFTNYSRDLFKIMSSQRKGVYYITNLQTG
jgi:hypothetical protein